MDVKMSNETGHDEARGRRIRELRQALGLTMEQAATKCGLAKASIQRYEAGAPIQTAKLEMLAAGLETTPGLIMGGDAPVRQRSEGLLEFLDWLERSKDKDAFRPWMLDYMERLSPPDGTLPPESYRLIFVALKDYEPRGES